MIKKFIPIIGAISAGKSTFLRGLLGTTVLESGASTTTRFVCLIQNSNEMKFYHVIPKKENGIKFLKEGEEIKDEIEIKKKIKEINENLSDKKAANEAEIFYMLEFPIKNIENISLLDECYFMDIPGLNEIGSSYIDIIFKLLAIDDIKFEIIIFDAKSIGSDNILNILRKLEKKNCLKKSGNLFILNKIDEVTKNNEDDIINSFKQYFYENFEDDKKIEKNDEFIFININENKFVPMNSFLYLAETNMKEDFLSMLIVEYFSYIENINNYNSFYEYLQKKLEFTMEQLNAINKAINLDVKSITKEEFEIIEKSVEEINKIKKQLNNEGLINIKLKSKETKNVMIKLFLIHKNNASICIHSKYYDELNKIMKEINTSSNDLSSPPVPKNINIKNLNITKKENNNKIDIQTLDELENFIKDSFNKIDPNNDLDCIKKSLSCIRENILGRKIRIAFIGNISVGKSSVLNSIIGEDILPTNDKECTYRGIIIRHVESEQFKLYKTRLETRGEGNDKYYYFIDTKVPYCDGTQKIKSYLNVKNNDKEIKDEDAYLLITGKLKIFDFIKLDKDIISKIEFIDLPGPDRKTNVFKEKNYYDKILRFSNSCVYINEPKTIDDDFSVNMMVSQYGKDKNKIFPSLRNDLIKTCVFVINKVDTLDDDDGSVKERLKQNIFKNISKAEPNLRKEDIIISFFSGKYFLSYLNVMFKYVYLFENSPGMMILMLHNEYNSKFSSYLKSFRKFILNEISKIEEKFFDDSDETDEVEAPKNFYEKARLEIENIEKINKFFYEDDDYEEVINSLYNLSIKLKKKDFKNTHYSSIFFSDLKRAIENSERLNKKNLKESIEDFFNNMDILFAKELKREKEDKKFEKKKELVNLQNIQPIIEECFSKTKENVKKIFKYGKERIIGVIDGEISDISKRLEEADKNLNKAAEILQNKINNIINEMKSDQKKELNQLVGEIEKKMKQKFQEKEIKIANSEINTNKGLTLKMLISVIASTISGVAIRTGLAFLGETLLTGAAAGAAAGAGITSTVAASGLTGALGGPVGIAVGVGVGLSISLVTLLVHIFSKEKRYENGLRDFREKMEADLNESENNCLEDFKIYEEDFLKAFNQKFSAIQKEIIIDNKQWEELKMKYKIQRDKIMEKIRHLE